VAIHIGLLAYAAAPLAVIPTVIPAVIFGSSQLDNSCLGSATPISPACKNVLKPFSKLNGYGTICYHSNTDV